MDSKRKTRPKKIGLALGGGAVLGAAHVGVLKAIDELNIPIHIVSGTSIGALVASLFAFSKNFVDVENIAMKIQWSNISEFSPSRIGLFSNKKMKGFLKMNIGDVDFKDARIPLAIVATNIGSGKKVILNKGHVAISVAASMSIPGIFRPVKIDNAMLVDGGVIENVPISPLKDKKADFIIAVDLNTNHTFEKPKAISDVLMNSFHFMMANSTKHQLGDADILIQPNLTAFNYTDIGQSKDLIEVGYVEAKKQLAQFAKTLQD